VRDADEAEWAVRAGVAVVDIKEPRGGSLGAAPPSTIAAIVARFTRAARDAEGGAKQRSRLSIALGELVGDGPLGTERLDDEWSRVLGEAAPSFVKVGLADAARLADWPDVWRRALQHLPAASRRVAVAYADWRDCGAPSVGDVLAHARWAGCDVLLVDTYHKHQGHLLDHLRPSDLGRVAAAARRHGLRLALAGSITKETLGRVLGVQPDWVAVRGAVCAGSRTDRICPRKLYDWQIALARQVLT